MHSNDLSNQDKNRFKTVYWRNSKPFPRGKLGSEIRPIKDVGGTSISDLSAMYYTLGRTVVFEEMV